MIETHKKQEASPLHLHPQPRQGQLYDWQYREQQGYCFQCEHGTTKLFVPETEQQFAMTTLSYNVSHSSTPQAKPQAVPHQILRPCFIADLPGFPGFFLKYNRGKLQYGYFFYPPSKKISLQMRMLPVICHNIDFAWGVEGCDTLSREYEYY